LPVDYMLYVSQARPGLSDEDLEQILTESRTYNAQRGITGLLLYVPRRDGRTGSFMQMLEGRHADIETLRERIFKDPRHHTKVVLESGTKPERDFSDWSMAFKNAPPESLEKYPDFRELGEEHFLERCRNGNVSGACEFLVDFWNDAD
jgi:hypothetical protein